MRYSVYDYINKKYDYYEADGLPPAYGTFRHPAPNKTPESLGVQLPSGAKKVGEGFQAIGIVAVPDSRALSAYGSEGGTPWYYMITLFALGWIARNSYEK